ncbi:MAG: lamin tail domain-containing protein [Candidatus Bipolaricaulia bacterium]
MKEGKMRACAVLLLVSGALGLGLLALADQTVFIEAIQPLGEDEVVTIVNRSSQPVELGGWRLESSNSLGQEVKETFWFPRDCLLPPGGALRVHSGPAAQGWASSTCAEGELAWLFVEVWNDKADVAWLRDSKGELVDLFTYTVGEAPPRARPLLRPGEKAELPSSFLPRGSACCPPVWRPPCLAAGCCIVRVILESVELVFNRGVGENWRLFASAGPVEPEVSPEALPLILYEDRFRGEAFIQLGAGAVERDPQPDRGWVQQELRLCCLLALLERTVKLEVYVRENEACCSGCLALWRFTFRVAVEPGFPTKVVAPPPQADFTIIPPGEHRLGDIVTLDGSSSVGEGLSYSWDLDGDGQADATGVRVEHRLVREGMNLVTLTVTDRLGRSDSLTKGIRVLPAFVKAAKFEGLDLGLFWLTLPAIAIGYFLAMAFRR